VSDPELTKSEIARLRRLDRHRLDPLGFVRWAFPWGEEGTPLAAHAGPEAWQAEVLETIGRDLQAAPANRGPTRVAVASGHGVGKSTLVAWLMLWSLATVPSTRGVVTANTETQLRTKTWAELSKWQGLALSHNWCDLSATSLLSAFPPGAGEEGLPPGGGRIDAVPWAAHNAEAFAGLHNRGSRILLVFDEASAIADGVWETAEGALTDGDTEIVWVVFGNPTRTAGRFHGCFNRFRESWRHLQVDSRNVSLTDKRQLARWIADYGEESDFVRVRIKGEFPRAGSMQFIGHDLVEQATKRPHDLLADRHAPLVMGVDVARFGDDRSVLFLRRGRDARSWPIEVHRGLDLMQLADKVVHKVYELGVRAVFVDEGGVGAGVVDRLRQLGVPFVFGVNFASAAERWDARGAKPLYANKRAEMWGNLKDWLGEACLPDSVDLRTDLTGVEYGYNGRGEIQLEKKEDMKRRGLASPDIGDALALTFAENVSAAAWDLPVQRKMITEYDLYAEFDDEYWESGDERQY
jgi:hypothetical protein